MIEEHRLILLAEDDDNDALLIQRAITKSGLGVSLKHVKDGHEAILYLSHALVEKTTPRPFLVLLDLKIPRKNGLEVLAWIRAQRAYTGLPVVVLTSSEDPADLQRAKRLGAHSYIVKSETFREVVDFAERLFVAH